MNRLEQIKKSWELKLPSRPIVESDIDWLIERVEKYENILREVEQQKGLFDFLVKNDWAISEDYFVYLSREAFKD